MKDIYFIKYGGSIITDKGKAFSVSYDVIDSLNRQIKCVLLKNKSCFIVGNGGGSFGHYYAKKYQLDSKKNDKKTLIGVCKGKNGNNYLNRIVVRDLLNKNISACSVRINLPYLIKNTNYSWEEVFLYLDNGILPVVYGDIVVSPNMQHEIISTEQVFLDISIYLNKYKQNNYNIKKFIFCTNTDGVLDAKGNSISKIDRDFCNNVFFWNNTTTYDVTGGMYEKVKKSLLLSKFAPVQIIDGRQPGNIIKAINGETIGTTISL